MAILDVANAFHILNPNKKNRLAVGRFFSKNDFNRVWINRTQHPTHLETVVEWAIKERYRRLFVWGGDGTFNRVVQRVFEQNKLSEIELALIPSGTCNDFARKIGLKRTVHAFKQLTSTEPAVKKFDIGLLKFDSTQRIFINNAGFGRYPRNGIKSNPISDILDLRSTALQVEWGNEKIHQFEQTRVLFGMVFNAPYFSAGLHFDRTIQPDDHILNGVLIPAQEKKSLFRRFFLGRLGRPLSDPSDIKLDCSFLRIESQETMFPQVDGEWATREGTKRLVFSVAPDSLSLLIPQG